MPQRTQDPCALYVWPFASATFNVILQEKQKSALVKDINAIGLMCAAFFAINFALLRVRTPTIYFWNGHSEQTRSSWMYSFYLSMQTRDASQFMNEWWIWAKIICEI